MPAFYNRATLRYGGAEIDSNTVQGELTRALAIAKSAVNETYRPGDAVTFAVTLTNAGATEASGLTLTDDLGAYAFGESATLVPLEYVEGSARYYVNGELQPAPELTSGAPLVVRNLRVPAGGDAELLFAARANEFAPLGAEAVVTGTARLDDAASAGASAGSEGAALPLFATAEIRPDARAQLTIRKQLNPAAVSAGEPLTYTLIIENSGASPVSAIEGASVTDQFNPLMDIASVRYNGQAWASPANYSYDANGGLFATAAGQLEVPAATYTQDANSGRWQVTPGASTIEITGTLR